VLFTILLRSINLFKDYTPLDLAGSIGVEDGAELARDFLDALVSGLGLGADAVLPGSAWFGYISAVKGMAKGDGRAAKYAAIRHKLENESLYSPASIARLYATDLSERQRCRMALHRFARYHRFPAAGDGTLRLKGQDLAPAWYGWRWKFPVIATLARDAKHAEACR